MNKETEPPKTGDGSGDGGYKPVIVGIGASAGGVAALQAFFSALPADTGAAFVVVVHLDPGTRSTLAEILGSRTRMPVVEVKTNRRFKSEVQQGSIDGMAE